MRWVVRSAQILIVCCIPHGGFLLNEIRIKLSLGSLGQSEEDCFVFAFLHFLLVFVSLLDDGQLRVGVGHR